MAKFTEEICKCIIENYSEGLTITDCADIAGVARETVHRWIKKGKTAKSGKYRQFYLDMKQARAKFKKHHHMKIAESKDWKASQYLLQVTDSETYVVTEKKQVNADVNSEVTVNLLEKMKQKRAELNDLDSD
jgi:predicted site-specific integrase-resolvase